MPAIAARVADVARWGPVPLSPPGRSTYGTAMNLVFSVVVAALLAAPIAAVAHNKGRHFGTYYLCAFLFSLPTLVVVLLLRPRRPLDVGSTVRLTGVTTLGTEQRLAKGSTGRVLHLDALDGKRVALVEFDGLDRYRGWLPASSLLVTEAQDGLGWQQRILGLPVVARLA